jgi:hypothetical protein
VELHSNFYLKNNYFATRPVLDEGDLFINFDNDDGAWRTGDAATVGARGGDDHTGLAGVSTIQLFNTVRRQHTPLATSCCDCPNGTGEGGFNFLI